MTIPELPEFCWTELIVNAIAYRDYSIAETDIQIKMFDDHLTVERNGFLPGLVRTSNMREVHFSRNPKIVEFSHVYGYVKEFGEGVDRMYRGIEKAGLPVPEYRAVEFCTVPRSREERLDFLGLSDQRNFRTGYLKPLLESGKLKMTILDKTNSRLQKYIKA